MNNIIQPLRFYETATEMLAKRHAKLGYKNLVSLVADRTHLLPFVVTHWSFTNYTTQTPVTVFEAINYVTGAKFNLLAYITLKFARSQSLNNYYIYYDGESTFPALGQGDYYLHLTRGLEDFYSDLFKIGFFTNTCTIQYRNSTGSFSNIWLTNQNFYKGIYQSFTYDSGEYSEHTESNKNEQNFDIYTYRRHDKLRNLVIFGDSNALDCIKLAQMCDYVFLTDEINKYSEIEIVEAAPNPVGRSNYMEIILKYRVKYNTIESVDSTNIIDWFEQKATVVIEPTEGLQFNGDNLTFNGETIKFG